MADNSDNPSNEKDDANVAANLIRQKISLIHEQLEPNAKAEMEELAETHGHLSKHQMFMQELTTSGKSLAEIQTGWHNYYMALPDDEKHQVWQEFYAAHERVSRYAKATQPKTEPQDTDQITETAPAHRVRSTPLPLPIAKLKTVLEIKNQLLSKILSKGEGKSRVKAKHHVQSLLFGLATGSVVVLLLLFGFFNERFVAPFITPSRSVSSTPIIIDPNTSGSTSPEPKIIIPKINVEVPVVYDQPSIEEKAIQQSLEQGVVHYAITPHPGEQGNAVIVGHSSNNILNRGKYKFAFVLLSRLENGDTFMINKEGKRYVYKVYDKRIVKPDDVSVLGNLGKAASVTLITCDPPGTSISRLIVVGEQISPDPITNVASSITPTTEQPAILPSNAPSLWQRIKSWFTS